MRDISKLGLPKPPIKRDKKYEILSFAFIMLVIIFILSVIALWQVESYRVSKIRMYQINASYFKDSTDGYYDPNEDFYCVWTKGYSDNQTEYIDNHEKCHFFVKRFYDYFCIDDDRISGYEYCYDMIDENYDHFCKEKKR